METIITSSSLRRSDQQQQGEEGGAGDAGRNSEGGESGAADDGRKRATTVTSQVSNSKANFLLCHVQNFDQGCPIYIYRLLKVAILWNKAIPSSEFSLTCWLPPVARFVRPYQLVFWLESQTHLVITHFNADQGPW